MYTRVSSLVAVLVVWATFVKTGAAQPVLPGSQVRVEKLFDARLADAERISLDPSLPSLDTTTVPQNYDVIPVESDIAYDPPKIRPLAIKTQAPPPAYKGFARAGAGLPLGWLADAAYVTRNDALSLRTDLHTYGINGNANDDQRVYEVRGLLGGSYYSDAGLAIDLDFDYDRRGYRYYGFEQAVRDTSQRLAEDLRNQNFSVFGIRAGVRNAKPTPFGIDYYATIDAEFMADNFANKERNTRFTLGGRKDFGEHWYAEMELDLDLTTFEAVAEQTLNNYSFRPIFGTHFDRLGFRGGIDFSSSDDEFRLFPQVEASYALGGGYVAVAGIEGGYRKNNFNTLTRYLPWLVVDPELRNAEEWTGYVGVQGQTRGVTYEGRVGFTRVNNLALFVADSALVYQFRPTYDTANILAINLSATMPVSDQLSGSLMVDSRFINPENAEEPFLLPSFDATLQLRYAAIPDKASIAAALAIQNSLPFLSGSGDSLSIQRTDLLLDLSIEGDYWFSKNLGAFAQLNNLFNNRREKFPNYPIVGINVLVGVVGRF